MPTDFTAQHVLVLDRAMIAGSFSRFRGLVKALQVDGLQAITLGTTQS